MEPSRTRRKVSRVNYAEDYDDAELRAPEPRVEAVEVKPKIVRSTVSSSPNGKRPAAVSAAADRIPLNWQPKLPGHALSNVVDLEDATMKDGVLHVTAGSTYSPEDYIYVLSEPPGEPYYIGRIMEFTPRTPKTPSTAVTDCYRMRVNWLYRPKDISKRGTDSRELYITMHSDEVPLHSLRGRCVVKLKDHIEDLDAYRATSDCFWFDRLYDRYIVRFYDVIPTEKMINMPRKLYEILKTRFKYAIVELNRGKEICEAPKTCQRCAEWCSPDDSVQCAHCLQHHHMLCVDPPIYKKPTRGFGWSCAVCSGALEQKLQERKGLTKASRDSSEGNESQSPGADSSSEAKPTSTRADSGYESPAQAISRYEELEAAIANSQTRHDFTAEQERQLRLWPFRYLGMHSRLEDILDTDDRIYPRAASRLGPKNQANVADWPGRPVVYVESDRAERKKKGSKTGRPRNNSKDTSPSPVSDGPSSQSAEVVASSLPRKEWPAWMQNRPAGYVERGVDTTSTLLWKQPENPAVDVPQFLEKAAPYAEKLAITPEYTNFIDACLKSLLDSNYDAEEALKLVALFTRKSLKEPILTAQEKKRFEDAVRKYGSELHPVFKEVGNKRSADIVRYYYLWKKTPEGHAIWDNYEGRRNKKKIEVHTAVEDGLADDVADPADDSSYDAEMARIHRRTFSCKFCATTTSRRWRRAPGHPVAGESDPVIALCIRCARLWRRYAVQWEEPEEVVRRANLKGGASWKRKVEEELLADARAILAEREKEVEKEANAKRPKLESPVKERVEAEGRDESKVKAKEDTKAKTTPAKKPGPKPGFKHDAEAKINGDTKAKMATFQSTIPRGPTGKKTGTSTPRKRPVGAEPKRPYNRKADKPVESKNPSFTDPLMRACAVCTRVEHMSQQLFCQNCGLNVHAGCYGASPNNGSEPWLCDPCSNDVRPCVSTYYTCVLCPVRDINYHVNFNERFVRHRDAMKRTYDNHWAHVRCATFLPETKFGDGKLMQPVENIPCVSKERFSRVCIICGTVNGATIGCSVCPVKFHVGCAAAVSYHFGFELQPSKPGRRDSTKSVTFQGRTGCMVPFVACLRHVTPDGFISLADVDASGKTSLQVYCQNYKQSESVLTGAMKKASTYLSRPVSLRDARSRDIADTSSPMVLIVQIRDGSEPTLKSSWVTPTCGVCSTDSAAYWFETVEGANVVCPGCYWKKKDPEAYQEEFPEPRISIIGPLDDADDGGDDMDVDEEYVGASNRDDADSKVEDTSYLEDSLQGEALPKESDEVDSKLEDISGPDDSFQDEAVSSEHDDADIEMEDMNDSEDSVEGAPGNEESSVIPGRLTEEQEHKPSLASEPFLQSGDSKTFVPVKMEASVVPPPVVPPLVVSPSVVPPSVVPPSVVPPSVVPPSVVPPSVVPPSVIPPSVVPPSVVPPSVVAPSVVPPSVIPPSVVPPSVVPALVVPVESEVQESQIQEHSEAEVASLTEVGAAISNGHSQSIPPIEPTSSAPGLPIVDPGHNASVVAPVPSSDPAHPAVPPSLSLQLTGESQPSFLESKEPPQLPQPAPSYVSAVDDAAGSDVVKLPAEAKEPFMTGAIAD